MSGSQDSDVSPDYGHRAFADLTSSEFETTGAKCQTQSLRWPGVGRARVQMHNMHNQKGLLQVSYNKTIAAYYSSNVSTGTVHPLRRELART